MARQANHDRATAAAGPADGGQAQRRPRQRGEPQLGEPADPANRGRHGQPKAAKGRSGKEWGSNGAPSQPGPDRLMLDVEFVRELIAAVDDSGIDTLEINRGGTRIRISKTPVQAAVPIEVAPAPSFAAPPAAAAATAAAPVAGAAAPPEPEAAPPEPETKLIDVTSPMVGTFFRAPAPEAPPYVEIGSHVSKGQTLCILEAMKLMNELEAEVDGVVREILAENADPVEYGQVLFRIEPAGS